MTGLLIKKYHIAVMEEDKTYISEIIAALKSWYKDRVVIETFDNPRDMFEAVNLNELKHKPFDMAVLSPDEIPEKMILRQVNPSLNVVICDNIQNLKIETSKLLL